MDVEFSVDVIKHKALGAPCVESPAQIMVLGQGGSLDDALRAATAGLTQWLQRDYPYGDTPEADMAKKAAEAECEALIGPGLFRFLKDLKAHNDREWFTEHKARYEAEARDPMLRLIGAFSGPLASISRHFIADPRPSGGSMFRIYRDTRFSKDKSPYKTHLAAHFPHRTVSAGGVHGPGFYLHLEPGGSFAGGGLWHPDSDSLLKVRQAIATKPAAWKALRKPGLEIEGEALQRVPQGFASEHPFAEDLKLKDFYITTSFTDAQVRAPEFVDEVASACRRASPLVAFLCKALDLPW